MATQNASNPASRTLSMDSKVAVGSSKPNIARKIEQPLIGKQKVNGASSMPGSKGKGQGVATVKSNPISGAANVQKGNTAMGSGATIPGFV